MAHHDSTRTMRVSDYLRLCLLAALWGASFLFMKIAAPVLGPWPTAFFRVLFGLLGLCAILALMRASWRFQGKLKHAMALGVINSGLPFAMYCLAAQWLPAGYSAIFNATTPLMGIAIGALFFGEAITGRKLAGVCLGLGGVAALTTTGPTALSWPLAAGALACLVSTGCYGLAGFLTRRWITERGGLDARLVALGSQLGATLLLAPVFAASVAVQPPASWGGPGVWAALLALGLLCTAAAYVLYFRLIADIGPLRSLSVTFLVPVFGVLWGALFLHEAVTGAHLLDGGLIAAALALVLAPAPKPLSSPLPSGAAPPKA